MSIAHELQKLEELRRSGALTDEEFARAKAAVLAGQADVRPEPAAQHLSEQLAEVHYQNELAQIDRAWQIERQQYLITGQYGRQQVPTTAMGIAVAVGGGLFGLLWTVLAFAITGSGPDFGAFGIARVIFPLFGVVFIAAAIGYGIYCYKRAQAYERAYAAYQARRRHVSGEGQ